MGEQGKAANMADWLESRLHSLFTQMADDAFGEGRVMRDERIALSAAVGDALDAFHAALQEPGLAGLYTRGPWDPAPDATGTVIKAGRVLSTASRKRIAAALAALQELESLLADADAHDEPAPDAADDGGESAANKALATVKTLGENRIGGYAVIWGDAQRRDLSGEYFTAETAELDTLFKAVGRLPFLYHHALDGMVKSEVVGLVDVLEPDGFGLWYEAQLSKAARYRQVVLTLVRNGALGTSTGTLPGARKAAADGRIERWPIAEVSGTPTPMEPRMMERPLAEIKGVFAELGLRWPDQVHRGAEEARAQELARELELLAVLELASAA